MLSLILVLLLCIPAAYALSIKPVEKWTDVLFFFLSTKFLPPIAALLPIYIITQRIGALDNVYTLVILYTSMNLPIAVWMMRSFLAEVPKEILEAASMDGAGLATRLIRIVLPIVSPGIAATSLICVIFAWNEFMFALNLTSVRAATAPFFVLSGVAQEGLFLAKALRGVHDRVAAGGHRRVRGAGQARARALARRDQVTRGTVQHPSRGAVA
ncbi:hypothetical protein GCM10025868_20890 [Angustibacter aerolatus]|uniref:ABC transmembrane type-1 domain-containing protein n=1 Tax=Angustibacter aerolatus TaxID=1162965 RepID=A0ABQ6JIB1_9ACTN|nr:carbohydrate ABC transporter permease [Angustibacter aerolatus]GMA86839.1 hypothetical protein GCM10025868_20890 [Angustibacter aerolatus]